MMALQKFPWLMFIVIVASTACQHLQATAPDDANKTKNEKPPTSVSPLPPKVDQTSTTDDSAEAWLQRIEIAAAKIRTLHADVIYDRVQQLVGDRQRRFGSLTFQTGPPAQFAIEFDRLLVDRRLDHDKRTYTFDGQWLTERYDNEKLLIRRQLVPPTRLNAKKPPADPMALGTGPLVLPINFKKEDVQRRFEARLIPSKKEDPPTSVHLQLVPKPQHKIDLTDLHIWYDRETVLPVRVRTSDDSENESTIQLKQVRVNEIIEPNTFGDFKSPGRDWRVEVHPLKTDEQR